MKANDRRLSVHFDDECESSRVQRIALWHLSKRPQLMRFGTLMHGSLDDLLQEVVIRMLTKVSPESRARFSLVTIVKKQAEYACMSGDNMRRARYVTRRVLLSDFEDGRSRWAQTPAPPDRTIERTFDAAQVDHALVCLSERERDVLTRRVGNDELLRTVAQSHAISIPTVRAVQHAALVKVKAAAEGRPLPQDGPRGRPENPTDDVKAMLESDPSLLDVLSPAAADVVRRRLLEGESIPSIADAVLKPIGAVRKLLRKGAEKLRMAATLPKPDETPPLAAIASPPEAEQTEWTAKLKARMESDPRALVHLTSREREVVTLRVGQGKTFRLIASETGVTESTVRETLRRALSKLSAESAPRHTMPAAARITRPPLPAGDEGEQLEAVLQRLLESSRLFDRMTVGAFRQMQDELRDCLRKWTADVSTWQTTPVIS